MLAPHDAVHAKFGIGWGAPEDLDDLVILCYRETKFLGCFNGDGKFAVQFHDAVSDG
jgi:hypothetical protein